MKKKLVVVASLLLAMSSLQVVAQKNKNEKLKTSNMDKALVIETTSDTLSYAYGANLVEQGLKQYLDQLKINDDPEKLASFLKGLNETLTNKGGDYEYVTGLGVGSQIFKMSEQFTEQINGGESVNELNINLIAKGVNDALNGKSLDVSSPNVIVDKILAEANKRDSIEQVQKNVDLKTASEKFMEENKTKDGVVTLPSGLQYKILEKGNGEIPTATDKVKVHYAGSLVDGTEFDSSYKRNEPLTIQPSGVIKGWTEALQLMPVGSKWILYIPYDLAYGVNGTGPIPPYSDLIFELNLIEIEK